MKAYKRKAFTLIELLVVIAVIALLMAVIMPALHAAKEIAAAAVCMSNNRQLGMSYYTYADENDGYLADGQPALTVNGYKDFDPDGDGTADYRGHCFTGEPRNDAGSWNNTCLEDKIRGFEVGAIWPYLESPEVYHCPVDKRWRKPPTAVTPSSTNSIGGYRSYSLGAVLSAGAYGLSTGEGDYAILKYSGFSNPGSKIVFLEEQAGDGFNQNYWDMYLTPTPKWWDPFAIVHNGSSTFAYADGHADRHRWTDKNMIEYAAEGKKQPPVDTTSDDIDWFMRAYIPGRKTH